MNPALRVLAAFLLGLLLGVWAGNDTVAALVEPVGSLWINALRMPIIPLIVALTIGGVASIENAREASTLTMRAILVFLALLVIFTAITTPLAPLALSGLSLDAESTSALRTAVGTTAAPTAKLSFLDWALSLVPVNPFKAAADGALLPVVVFSLSYGLALTKAADSVRDTQVRLLKGVSDTLIIVIRGVLFVAPIGVFALAYTLGARVGASAAGAVAVYIAVTVTAIVAVMLCLYALTWLLGGIGLQRFAAALLPAQTIALGSRSSLAALPALIDGVQAKLDITPSVTAVVLPLGASIFKINSAVTWSFGAVLVSALYGVTLDSTAWLIFAVGTVLLSFTTPGIPSGGFLVQAPLYVTVGLPVEGLGILIAVDLIPDAFKTALNVTGYATSAALVQRWSGNPEPTASNGDRDGYGTAGQTA